VIVPAHDEQGLLGACLDAVAASAGRVRTSGIHVRVVVVADACTDATRATARARGATCVTENDNNVGAARAAGTARAVADLTREGFSMEHVYLLHTDADTLVPPDWITRHLLAASQHDAVLGPVSVYDWSQRSERCARRYERMCELEPDEHRIHGANLGVRADTYLRVGGFAALPVAEDRALIGRIRAAGESVVFRRDLAVRTSARTSRRVRGGFSDYLSGLEHDR
jgi:GT2 family glycosyltransferase